ncbi:MAG: winged helix-turn-helix transcriptional regulator [Chloroflexi bacterium AL-W]|nr:winged helix-turn-helix transcriptional regulator [Chloroflexi bacterium AL-N1]NOK68051.1 winged helix-turn-helix transcriptional regulator [Chloroflexi bacterium AL-N10]NOK73391.1 winged helix-turn-helix transcriptional regulator [Chloroflexi bacterium AL-N5]NOK83305.1 winged helix-turn-helix transcriptional regulator [Chloroflexi bacterium AL-W]NOK87722.1 winged helix-turn-helix transcriptional regulator [Chloroflexi bacterium AL-N15]
MELTRTLQALTDPTRRAILEMLNEGDMTAGDIAAHFNISAPSVSHHLNVLKNADLVQSQRRGQTIIYTLNATVVQEFLQELLQFFRVGEGERPFLRSKKDEGHA